jgi:hypothetical protein
MTSVRYEIVVEGPVGTGVVQALEGFEVAWSRGGFTLLRGWIVDQSRLHAVLDRIAGFGLDVTSVMPVDDES